MSDRELLEAAAKAAGMCDMRWSESTHDLFDERDVPWNPLTNDGDALRLAVKLRLDILPSESSVLVFRSIDHPRREQAEEDFGDDPYAATRRAIVLVAAALQEPK